MENDELSIIAEKMPPHTAEDMHCHNHARQFFYILSGSATMRFISQDIELKANEGIEINPKEPHQMVNNTDKSIEFIVVSMPKSHGDKIIVDPKSTISD